MDQQLVIKLENKSDGSIAPVGLIESPPMLYTNLKALHPTISFSDKIIASEVEPYLYGAFNWAYLPTDLPYNKSADNVGLKKHEDGFWKPTFIVRDATTEEIANRTIEKSNRIRGERNAYLRQTDYTQLQDVNIAQAKVNEYVIYRKQLRDLPLQDGFPWNVIFPIKP